LPLAEEARILLGNLPRLSCSATHLAISATEELIEPAGPVVEIDEVDDLESAVKFGVRPGVNCHGLKGCVCLDSLRSSEGKQNVFADVVFPGLSGDGGDDLSGCDVQQIVVSKRLRKLEAGFMKRRR